MFTGIITDMGTVAAAGGSNKTGKRFKILTKFLPKQLSLGASICCSGACMTVIRRGAQKQHRWFEVDVSPESLNCTHLGEWKIGTQINLESSLKVGDELGGHIVTGHVDGLGCVKKINRTGENYQLEFEAPKALSPMIAAKGSITVDGVSLTVNQVKLNRFTVNIIPHTWKHTTLGQLKVGSRVNLEIDILARYTARLLQKK